MEVDTDKCPFCREPAPYSEKEWVARYNKRMEAGDAYAFEALGTRHFEGGFGLPKESKKGFELYSRASELGLADFYSVGNVYHNEKLVESDLVKAVYHWQQAAMLGMGLARHNLGCYEAEKGNDNRSMVHWIIAAGAGAGIKESLESVRQGFLKGRASKADYEKALRNYQKYMDEVTSDQRDRAAGRYKSGV